MMSTSKTTKKGATMKKELLNRNDKSNNRKIPYEKPEIKSIDQNFGIIVMGGSNIIDDEDHEYEPDND